MKIARVTLKPCQRLTRLNPKAYIGYQLNGHTVEHLVIADNQGHKSTVSLKVHCGECLFCHFLKTTKIVGTPTLEDHGRIRFTILYTGTARRLINRHRDRLESLEVYDYRSTILTEKQRKAIQIAAEEGLSPTRVAEKLGVSRQAAGKLLRKAMAKIARTIA